MRLYHDACAIIYSFEDPPAFRIAVQARIRQMQTVPGSSLITSRLSRLECRVKPLRDQQAVLLARYDAFFNNLPLILPEISAAVIERATDLRAAHGFKTPDAIHLATAIEEHADIFLTGDARLAGCPGLLVDVI